MNTPPSLLLPEQAGQVQWGTPSNGLQVGVAANKITFRPNTLSPTLLMACSLRNVGDKSVRVLEVSACQNGQATLELSVNGKPLHQTATVVTAVPPPPPAWAYIDLAPGQTRTASLSVEPGGWQLSDAFEADIRFRYVNHESEASLRPQRFGRLPPKPTASIRPGESGVSDDTIRGLWTGEAVSPDVRVKVAPMAAEPTITQPAKRYWWQKLFGLK